MKDLVNDIGANIDAKNWYEKSAKAIAEKYGDQKYLFIRVLAATSPLKSVKDNLVLADKVVRFLDFTSTFGAHSANLERVEKGLALSGLKVHHFCRALLGDPNAVPIDRHMFAYFNLRPSPKNYLALVDKVRTIARLVDLEPRQVQACLWAAQKRSKGQVVMDYSDLIGQI